MAKSDPRVLPTNENDGKFVDDEDRGNNRISKHASSSVLSAAKVQVRKMDAVARARRQQLQTIHTYA
jgi:hypothetical protein